MHESWRSWGLLIASGCALVGSGACGSTEREPSGDIGESGEAGSGSPLGGIGGNALGGIGGVPSGGSSGAMGGDRTGAGGEGTGAPQEPGGGASPTVGAAGEGGAAAVTGCLLGYPSPPLTTIDAWPRIAASRDMNDDGRLDLVVGAWLNLGDHLESSLSILLGRGDGTFAPPREIDLGDFAGKAMALADFNDDQRLDVALVGSNGKVDGDSALVFLNAGGGELAHPATYAVGDTPMALVATDLDADGLIDLAVANYYSADVTILLNTGGGVLGAGKSIRSGVLGMSIVAEDFDGDGWNDLALAEQRFSFNILVNQGHGKFVDDVTSMMTGAGVEQVQSLAVDDFDDDGQPDLAFGYEGDFLDVHLNAGALTFAPGVRYEGGGSLLSVTDLNGDGFADLASTDGVELRARLNLGDGAFGEPISIANVGLALLVPGDFDGDARTDVSVFSIRDYQEAPRRAAAGVLLNRRGDAPGALLRVLWRGSDSLGYPGNMVTVADLNGDRLGDLMVVDVDDSSLHVLFGGAELATSEGASYPNVGPFAPELADFNADERVDVVTADATELKLQVRLNAGNGELGEPRTYPIVPLQRPVVGDFDGDGRSDIAAVSADLELDVLLNQGNGDFASKTALPLVPLTSAVVAADFDLDGKTDLALAVAETNVYLQVLLSSGDATFLPPVEYSNFAGVHAATAADVDADGDADLALVSYGGLRILANSGDGTFAVSHDYALTDVGPIVAVDANLDGHLDLAVLLRTEQVLSVYLNDGRGGFSPSLDYFAGLRERPGSLAVGDLNGEQTPDLAVGLRPGGGADVLFGRCEE